ncbi:DUF2314 domain-containing protein [Sandarakinorhabdus rubra]|uniref:DUF2314 domain-containing protein n=1 Tax=Sandarakinorhabdus rubra TaxID=2672568 RepID=UPI0013DD3CA0|nr:DUF2314 domain-containing protein [Sandarakinorhabdus rubra]
MLIIRIVLLLVVAAWAVLRHFQAPAGIVFALDDPRAEAAKQQARETLGEFWAAFEAGAPEDRDFGLKFDLNHGSGLPDRELIWALDITREDGVIRGTLGNPPLNPAFQMGQSVVVPAEAIVDWAFFRSGVAHGHYLTRLMIEQSPDRHARQARAALGW